MRIGVVIDSACDLPPAYIAENKIVVLPITLNLNGKVLVDDRNAATTAEFYDHHVTTSGEAETSAFSAEQIKKLFLERLVLDYDLVFVFTIASSRSPMFENAVRASHAILADYKPVRAAAGITTPFSLRIIDTQNCFCGQAIPVIECIEMIKAGEAPNKIRERVEYLASNTHGYLFPRDLKQLRARAQKKGDKSVGWLKYAMGSALDIKPVIKGYRNTTGPVASLRHFDDGIAKCFKYVEGRLREGLYTPVLTMSYAGDLADLKRLPGYASLIKTAQETHTQVVTSIMGMVGAIHVGEGAVAFAFACGEHELDL